MKFVSTTVATLATALFAVSSALGTDRTFVPASGDFLIGSNWTPAFTTAWDPTDRAIVTNAGTVLISSGTTTLTEAYIGNTGMTKGTFQQSGGALTLSDGLIVGRQGSAVGTYTMTGGSLTTRSLRLGGGATTATGTMTVSGAGTTFTSGTGSATTALVDGIGVNGTGTFTLSNSAVWNHSATPLVVGGDNTATGATNNANTGGKGTLNVQSSAALNLGSSNLSVGRNPSANGTVVVDGGTITTTGAVNLGPLNGGTAGGTGVLTINTGAITAASLNVLEGTGAINFNGGTVTTGAIARNPGTVASPGTATLSFNGASIVASASSSAFHSGYGVAGTSINILSGGYLLNTGAYTVTINAPMSGAGPLVKTGSGTLTLNGANAYGGATTVGAGTLVINGNQSGANGSVGVSNGGTLGGVGTVGGATTVAAGCAVTGGTSGTVGTLRFSSNLIVNGRYAVDIASGSSDKLAIAGALSIGNGSSITVNVTSASLTAAKYVLATYSSLANGTNVHFTTENLPAGYTLSYTDTELDLVGTPGPNTPKPNVIIMLVDDLGWSDLGCYGGEIKTPNLDALAGTGMRFRQFCTGARCAPSRASILTGLYPQQVAVDPAAALPNLRTDNNVTVAELLKSNGYHTYMAGKWNLGNTSDRLPEGRGFEHAWRFLDGNSHSENVWDQSRYTLVSPNNEITPVTYTTANPFNQTEATGDYSLKFIDHDIAKNDGEPFFLYMAFGAPHFPLGAPAAVVDSYTSTYAPGWDAVVQARYQKQLSQGIIDSRYPFPPRGGTPYDADRNEPAENIPAWNTLDSDRQADLARRMSVFAAMVERVDANVGKVVNHLQEIGQLDNTLIFFLSDNGACYEYGKFGTWTGTATGAPLTGAALSNIGQPSVNDNIKYGGGWAHVSNTPLRLFKHFAHEGGIRSPFIVRWPNGFTGTGGWNEETTDMIDIAATIAAASGAAYPSAYNNHSVLPLEGVSLLSTLKNGSALPARNIEVEHESNRMIRSGRWKLVTKNFTLSDYSSYANQLELYDTAVDPAESNNVADAYPTLVLQLIDTYNAWANSHSVVPSRALPYPPTNVTVGQTNTDLFVDTFNRPFSVKIDNVTTGMSGSLLPSLSPGAIWFEGYEGSGMPDSIMNAENVLRMAVGVGMSENGLNHNFVDGSITNAGGFSVSLRPIAINSDGTDTANRFIGFGVGLNAAQAAAGNDIGNTGAPRPIRGSAANPGCADCFVELDQNKNVKVWVHGALQATVPVSTTTGTLTASFSLTSAGTSGLDPSAATSSKKKKNDHRVEEAETNGFNAGDSVTLSVYFNGQRLNLSSAAANGTLSFTWDEANANYVALSGRAVNYVQMDNFAVRLLPLGNTMALDYALSNGLDGANAAPTADPDGDGLDNYSEWALGADPTKSDRFLASMTVTTSNLGNQGFRFAHRRLTDYQNAGVTYRYAVSSDLTNWHYVTPAIVSITALTNSPGYEAAELRLPDVETQNQSRLFVRVEIPH